MAEIFTIPHCVGPDGEPFAPQRQVEYSPCSLIFFIYLFVLWCKTQPDDNVDHPPYLFFYQRQVWLLKYLRDLLAVGSLLQTAGVCSRVLDESSSVCFRRMILLQKKFGRGLPHLVENCLACGQLKPGMTTSSQRHLHSSTFNSGLH